MPNYDLNRLGDKEFERLCQSLLKEIIGNGTTTFGEGPDGGREATFRGQAPYPSSQDKWTGDWIFQVKYHDIQRIGPDEARKLIVKDLKSELDKTINKYKRNCNNYILITNVPLSSVHIRGTHDQIALEVVPNFIGNIPNIAIWGYDEVCRFLEKYSSVRKAYLSFITPGDIIAELMEYQAGKSTNLVQTVHNYMTTAFSREKYARLDQAGQAENKRINLKDVFIDLDAQFLYEREEQYFIKKNTTIEYKEDEISATELILSEIFSKIVLIGGPGEGKSTIGQYLAQVHRATLLSRKEDLVKTKLDVTPLVARIPFKVVLKDYAQWLDEAGKKDGLEVYLSEHVQELAATHISSESIQVIFQKNPCLLILDGLDEVSEPSIQSKLLDRIGEFLERCEHVLKADIQVLATSRPTSYSNQFDLNKFAHIRLIKLSEEKVLEYVSSWSQAKEIEHADARRLKQTIKDCLSDQQINLLMNTALQVTILILIVLSGGTPPRQREALFNEYLEVIYKRESAKATIRSNKQELFELHEYLGYTLHSRSSSAQDIKSSLSKAEFSKEVKRFLRSNDPYTANQELEEKVKAIVKEAEERLVLIVELEKDSFGFELRSIQEFFAAAHLANAPQEETRYARFEAIAKPLHWRNVALFFAGRIGRLRSAEAANIVTVCRQIDRVGPDQILRRGAQLSLELAADRSFGHKRTLQWDVIEYGLTLLQYNIPNKDVLSIIETLQKLPTSDIQDLAIPVLKKYLLLTDLDLTRKVLDVYHQVGAPTHFLLEALSDLFNTSEEESVKLALKKSIDFKIDPKWINCELKKLDSFLSARIIKEVPAIAILTRTAYIQICLKDIIVGDSPIISFTENALTGDLLRTRYVEGNYDKPFFATSNLSSLEDQMYFTFYITGKIIHFYMDEQNDDLDQDISLETAMQAMKQARDSGMLLPHLEAIFWIIILTKSKDNVELLDGFTSFYTKNKECKGVISVINIFTRRLNPLIDHLIGLIDEQNYHQAEILYCCINRYSSSEIESTYDKLIEDLDLVRGKQITLFQRLGPVLINDKSKKKAFEESFEAAFGISSYYAPEIFQSTYPTINFAARLYNVKVDISVILPVLKDIENNLGLMLSANMARITTILQLRWPVNEDLNKVAQSLLYKLLTNFYDKDLNMLPIIKLFIKLYEFDTPPKEITVLLLKKIATSKIAFISNTKSINTIKSVIVDLLQYIIYEDILVQQGCCVFINLITDNIGKIDARNRRFIKKEEAMETYKITIDPTTIENMLSKSEVLFRCTGINLINFIDANNYYISSKFREMIISCQNKAEAKAWARIIRNTNIAYNDDNQVEEWKNFLRYILERKSKSLSDVYNSSFLKYEQLVVSQKHENFFDENELELPFNQKE
ncbi:hypothetical protein ccbrp13_64610 [Ktedonobacteria bacterium brp13]|nr:hypothetical protein ccbrp13_64610 [Ktedonobacteria bacterium brp13]